MYRTTYVTDIGPINCGRINFVFILQYIVEHNMRYEWITRERILKIKETLSCVTVRNVILTTILPRKHFKFKLI